MARQLNMKLSMRFLAAGLGQMPLQVPAFMNRAPLVHQLLAELLPSTFKNEESRFISADKTTHGRRAETCIN